MNLPLWAFVLSQLIWAVVAGWAIYYGAYLKKKGKNLATHEDIAKLDEQVRVITTTTKEIETKISDEAWNRQERWELKRDVLFDAVKRLAEIDEALVGLNTTLRIVQEPRKIDPHECTQTQRRNHRHRRHRHERKLVIAFVWSLVAVVLGIAVFAIANNPDWIAPPAGSCASYNEDGLCNTPR